MRENEPVDLDHNLSEPGGREGVPSADFHSLLVDVGRITQQPGFDLVQRRARRLRTRRQLVVAGAGLAVVAVLGAAGLTVTRPAASDLPAATPSPSGPVAPTSPPAPAVLPSRPASSSPPVVRELLAGDPDHLYAVVEDCDDCQGWLMGSQDGGRTWQTRLAVSLRLDKSDLIRVVGPSAIMAGIWERKPSQEPCLRPAPECTTHAQEATLRISADAGATWRDLVVDDEPVESAPPSGGVVMDLMTTNTQPTQRGRLYAVDPEMGRIAPLANQPPLTQYEKIAVPLSAGVWLEGLDPTTRRPAVAVSRDGGASWVTSIFEAEKQVGDQAPVRLGISRPEVRTADGQTAFAMFAAGAGPVRIYRTTDGGQSWKRTNPDARSWDVPRTPRSLVVAGGRHVVIDRAEPTAPIRLFESTDGRVYQPFAPVGLPPIGIAPIAVDKDLFLYRDYNTIYRSEDGVHWQPLGPPK
ncbi:glycoside hydrolase [Micromonospora sp. NBC_01699]|uniref:sialidase family protein n=1 Tax=Micromonospora sp. NBC_01699 TaxID=2975984 RepID=UPI002E2B99C8|nr:sialidase family protein [Micromonospora sp. NBC_01699]